MGARFLNIINFEPDRWPVGDPRGLDDLDKEPPPYKSLAWDTSVAYADFDGSPTKAWMIMHRKEDDVEPLYQLSFGKRPREELQSRLLRILTDQADPRLVENPVRFEHHPYGGFTPRYYGKDELPRR